MIGACVIGNQGCAVDPNKVDASNVGVRLEKGTGVRPAMMKGQ